MKRLLAGVLSAILLLTVQSASASQRENVRMMRELTAQPVPGAVAKSTAPFNLEVDSIMVRDDVVRLYGKLLGTPNRSGLIESMMLRSGNITLPAVDTDGFDLERRFQWEEDGVIPIEIDFTPTQAQIVPPLTVDVLTDKGSFSWILRGKGQQHRDRAGKGRQRSRRTAR